jgi:Domain of unknown function (DUF3854)
MQLPSLDPKHSAELVESSGIAPGLASLNFRSLAGKDCYDYLFISPDLPRNNLGQVTPGWVRRYTNCAQGGWWCAGLDPLAEWQPMEWGTFKPDRPKRDKEGKTIKYEHPPQMATRLFCLRVDLETWRQIAQRHGKKLPPEVANGNTDSKSDRGFWPWVLKHKLPIVICEGAKKAASLLSHGYVAIGLPGINSGYRVRKDAAGNMVDRQLIPELAALLAHRPQVYICFDYETKPKTIDAVNRAIAHLGEVCQQSHCGVKVIRLPGKEKGVDEFLTAQGVEAFGPIYEAALDLETDLARTHPHHRLTYPAAVTLHQRYLHSIDFPASGIAGIKSAKGTGKTTALIPLIEKAQAEQRPVLLLTHRIQLGRFLCERIGVNWINSNLEEKKSAKPTLKGDRESADDHSNLGLCLDSLWKLNPEHWLGGIVILDEVEQSLWHLLNSSTCKSKRLIILKTFQQLISKVIASGGLVVAQDADLSDVSIDYLANLAANEVEPWIVVNEWQPELGWEVHFYDTPNPTALIGQLEQDLLAGHKCYVTTDSRSGRYGSDTLDKYIRNQLQHLENQYAKTLVICSQTTNTADHAAVNFVEQVNDRVTEYDAVFVTPTLGTGVSIDVEHFDRVYGLFQGVIPDPEVRQALARVRANVPRHVWCTKRGLSLLGSGSNNYRSLAFWYQENHKESYALMCPHQKIDVDVPLVYDPMHLRAWSKFAARINASITLYRESIRAGLLLEGHRLQNIDGNSDREKLADLRQALVAAAKTDKKEAQRLMSEIFALQQQVGAQSKKHQLIKDTTKNIQQKGKLQGAKAVAAATDISPNQYQFLTGKRFLTEAERQQVSKYMLKQRYGVKVTADLKLKDEQGYYGQLLTHFYLTYHQQFMGQSRATAAEQPESQVFLPDINNYTLKIQGLVALGIPELLDLTREFRADDADLVALQRMACLCSQHIKRAIGLHLSVDSKSLGKEATITILGKFLGLLGMKLKVLKSTTNNKGKKTKVHVIDPETWQDGRDLIFGVWRQNIQFEPLPESVNAATTIEAQELVGV